MSEKKRAPRNRTITLDDAEHDRLRCQLVAGPDVGKGTVDATLIGDCFDVAARLTPASVDMLFLDPPYNLNKRFGERSFTKKPVEQYTEWLAGVLDTFIPTVKPDGTVYICGDWHTSASIFAAASERLNVRNRITWEREKGRGAKTTWKNSSEDIRFCTVGDSYTFNVDQVKVRRKVIAPYRNGDGTPKD